MPCRHCAHCRNGGDDQETDRAKKIRQAIDDCRRCDQVGRLNDQTNCPDHPNFRMPKSETEALWGI